MTSDIQIHHANCLDIMPNMYGIDLIVTSPPYGTIRSYEDTVNDDKPFDFEGVASACYGALKPNGILCWNVGDQVINGSKGLIPERQSIFFTDSVGFKLVSKILYKKSFPKSYGSRKPYECWEPVYIFAKGDDYIYNPIYDRPNKNPGAVRHAHRRAIDGSVERGNLNPPTPELGARHDIWSYGVGKFHTRNDVDGTYELEHPAMMPRKLAEDLITSWSNPGDTVLDPMAGSGTTLVAAIKTGRDGIGIERVEKYVEMMRRRTRQRNLV